MAKLGTLQPRLAVRDWRRVAPPPKTVAPHYLTPEHRAWRIEVLRRAAGACRACHRRDCRLYADHIVELRDGGAALDPANGQALCPACHTRKTAAARAARLAHPHTPPPPPAKG